MRRNIGSSGTMWIAGVAAAVLVSPALAQAPTNAPPAAVRVDILNLRTYLRYHVAWRQPAVGTAATWQEGKTNMGTPYPAWGRWIRSEFSEPTPFAPAGWERADFDDSGWMRGRGPFFEGYGCEGDVFAALVCVRGRFGVTDPGRAQGMELALSYRGGAVVYLNGQEIARGHLPAGPLEPQTFATDYSCDAFLMPDGETALPAIRGREQAREGLKERYDLRIRRLATAIPVSAVRSGVNVLAVEVHRAAVPTNAAAAWDRCQWGTAGLVDFRLTAAAGSAVQPNVNPPSGAYVWNAAALFAPGQDAAHGDPFEPLRPISLACPRNGFASGQVVANLTGAAQRVSGRISDLRCGRDAIPAAACRVRYGAIARGMTALYDSPPEAAGPTNLPVWVTVQTPADAPPGRYAGELTLSGMPAPVAVPVELTVYGWRVGSPREWKTSVNLLQSPESVAKQYGATLWSDEHFRFLEKSLELLGQAGNGVVTVGVLGKSVFGDDPLVVFRKEGDSFHPDFRYARRYLELYRKHAGNSPLVCLHVWNYGIYQSGATRDGGKEEWRSATMPIQELRDGVLTAAEVPNFDAPGAEPLWREVMDGFAKLVEELGWSRDQIVLGTAGDAPPSRQTAEMFRRIAPYALWRVATHGSSVGNWGETPAERTQRFGMVVRYPNIVRRLIWLRPKVPGTTRSVIARDEVGYNPLEFFSIAPLAAAANYDGFCMRPMDYWHDVLSRYVGFGNITPHGPRSCVVPGPEGAIPTVQFEMMREGIQATEAVQYIRDRLADPESGGKLGEDLCRRSRAVLQVFSDVVESAKRRVRQGGDVSAETRRVYETAAEISRAREGGG